MFESTGIKMPTTMNISSGDYLGKLIENSGKPQQRIIVGIPMTGLVRAEWMVARYGQVIPCNWGQADLMQYMDGYSPVQYSVADARNIIANEAVKQNFEWLFFIDHDTIIPQGTILKLNERMINDPVPAWSGLYFTKSVPAEPLVYRGFGQGYFDDWMLGDDVWVSALPMGCTMINVKLLKVMYDEAEDYIANGMQLKRIFETPAKIYYDINTLNTAVLTGTEDINWCKKVVDNKVFEKAGFPEYQDKEFPFLVDTSIFCRHIDWDGKQFPIKGEEFKYIPKNIGTTKEEFLRQLRDRFNMLELEKENAK
jgi:hypothetical protein